MTHTAQTYNDRATELLDTFINGNRKEVAAEVVKDAMLAVMVADGLDTDDRDTLVHLMMDAAPSPVRRSSLSTLYEPNNDDRAGWAQQAVDHFRTITSTDDEDAIGDLLCNLCHLIKSKGGDPREALDKAFRLFEDEVAFPDL